jgi:ABC-2 type transport system ATP-binding protein
MREIKSSYPRNRVRIHFEGGDGFLQSPKIETLKRYPGYAEIKLRSSATLADDAQSLLAEALQIARITHFEVTEPTLEQIFIEKVLENSPGNALDLSLEHLEEPEESYLDA